MGEQAVTAQQEVLWRYEDPADVVEIFPCPMGRPFDMADRLHDDDTYCLDNDSDFRIPIQSPWIECSWFGLASWVDVGGWKEIEVKYDTYRKRDPKKELLPSTFGVNYAYSVLRANRVAYRVSHSSEWEVCFPYSLEYLGEAGRYDPDPMIGGNAMIADGFRVTTRILTGGVPRAEPRIRISFLGSEKPRPIPLPSIKVRGIVTME